MDKESSKSDETPAKYKALSRAERKVCYDARDVYFKCLDKNNEDLFLCEKERRMCEKVCPKLWVGYVI